MVSLMVIAGCARPSALADAHASSLHADALSASFDATARSVQTREPEIHDAAASDASFVDAGHEDHPVLDAAAARVHRTRPNPGAESEFTLGPIHTVGHPRRTVVRDTVILRLPARSTPPSR